MLHSTKCLGFVLAAAVLPAGATLIPAGIFTGNVGVSIDGLGSNSNPVGQIQAEIPVGATVLQAYLYSAGTPFPWYANSPQTLADYNGAGISLAGNAITSFDTLVGATSTLRPDIGQWFTARADVTSLVQSLTAGAVTSNFSWDILEGTLNDRIDGEVLVIVYSHGSLPAGSVVLLNGGQDTAGETTNVALGTPLPDPMSAGFLAEFSIASSFSCCGQSSEINVNGITLTTNAGDNDDGLISTDGSLITVGGIGDDPSNNVGSYASDDELYDLRPFLNQGDTSFSIFTTNATGDDNIFFASLRITADVTGVNQIPPPGDPIPEPATGALLLTGAIALSILHRRRRRATTPS